MKITQLVATNTKQKYHESVASRLPKGIKTQQQLFKLGYKIAVEELGLEKAKRLNENFAANLVNSYHNRMLNEGIGSFLGKAAGHVAGAVGAAGRGLKGAWNDAKAGYQSAKASWDPQTGAPTPAAPTPAAPTAAPEEPAAAEQPAPTAAEPAAAPSPGGATPTPPAAGTPPTTPAAPAAGGVSDIMKAIDSLDPESKKQLAGELDKSIKAAPAAEKPAEPAAPTPATPAAEPPPAAGAAPAAPTPGAAPTDATKQRTGGKVKGQLSQTPDAIRKREARAKAAAGQTAGAKAFGQMASQLGKTSPSQAEIDADRERLLGPDNGGANESRSFKFKSRFLGMDI